MAAACRIRLGTRASPLARWQAEWVAAQLSAAGAEVELVPVTTAGDRDQLGPVASIGGQGLFTKEIQTALLDRRVDLAVHSLKDLPTEPAAGLVLAAVPKRESTADVLVSRDGLSFDLLPRHARIGTGSTRRRAQLWHVRPDLRMADVRGNIDTRLRKLDGGEFDALVLAEAGLKRLGLAGRIAQVLPASLLLPAVGQGALGLETREDDAPVRRCLAQLDDAATHAAVLAERSLLRTLRGGCLAPVGALARVEAGGLSLAAVVCSHDGRRRLDVSIAGPPDRADDLGRQAADELLSQGAAELIQAARAPG
jgi:hydroxymethylbilane synthase